MFTLYCTPAHAEQRQITIHYTVGTGFFVNREGYVVTNEHVVRSCKRVTVEGAVPVADASIVSTDRDNDLALLKTAAVPSSSASLRDEADVLAIGERVITVGFPGGNGPIMKDAQLLDTKGPTGEAKWLQFSDAVKKGNSGGPLLDGAGNVIGVVMAKAQIITIDAASGAQEDISNADIGIRLPTLRSFLSSNNARWRDDMSGVMTSAYSVDARAREFIVKVMCEQ